jgi:lipoprotein-anchoring transpeptidase ErfK/SrfK
MGTTVGWLVGEGVIQWRQPWPRWKVPAEMVARQPKLAQYSVEAGGMDPGVKNPLGARTLYFQRWPGHSLSPACSPEWESIGTAASFGCVRFVNQDILDLYTRVPYHARIVVHQGDLRTGPAV